MISNFSKAASLNPKVVVSSPVFLPDVLASSLLLELELAVSAALVAAMILAMC
jgi:hypothetical protein